VPVGDLSDATRALQRHLELNIARIDPALVPPVTIATLPPERVTGGANVLVVYLYHVAEDPDNRLRPRQSGAGAIASSPLSLLLHYILTPRIATASDFDALSEQRLLGHAMKAVHDMPVIADGIRVGDEAVLPVPLQGRENRFELVAAPMTAPESLAYWANDDEATARLSFYLTMRGVELAPEPPRRLPGIVLSLGTVVFPGAGPSIGASESTLVHALPAALGGGQASATVSPARAGPVNPAAPPETNRLRLRGAGLSAGTAQRLYISHPLWARLLPEAPRQVVDLALNAALGWDIAPTEAGAEIAVGDALDVRRPDDTVTRLELYPGTYLLRWSILRAIDEPGGGARFIEEPSNEVAISVVPRITGMARDAGTGAVTLAFGGLWRLDRGRPMPADPGAEPELDILFSVDGVGYRLRGAGEPAAHGSFVIAAHSLTYSPTAAANAPGLHSLRVVIDGAEAQPFWIEIA
jgi:hypothetical protein